MTSPESFANQIDSLDIENNLHRTVSSSAEAKTLKQDCVAYQKQLRQIKKSIGLEIKGIRAEYRDKIANAGSLVGGAFSLFGKRGMGGNIRADAKRVMTRERDDVIGPYDHLKLLIDDYIHSIDNSKVEIDGWVQQLKSEEAEEKKAKSNSSLTSANSKSGVGRFCGACGAKAAKSHKFCTQCGQKLDEI